MDILRIVVYIILGGFTLIGLAGLWAGYCIMREEDKRYEKYYKTSTKNKAQELGEL